MRPYLLFRLGIFLTLVLKAGAAQAQEANPFSAPSALPLHAPMFDKIKDTDYLPAFDEGIKQQLAEIDRIANNLDSPTFENTIVAIEASGRMLNRVAETFDAVVQANTSDTLTKTSALLSHASVSIDNLNASLVELPATVRNAGKLLGDPNIPVIFSNLAGIAADGKKEADKLITPVTKAKAAFMFAWNSTLRFAGAFFGVK